MRKKGIMRCTAFCFLLLVFTIPNVSAGWEEMEIIKYNFDVDAGPRSQWYPWTVNNPVDNEFMVSWRTSGRLRDNCEEGDEYECSNSFQTIEGQRVSIDGVLLGDQHRWSEPNIGWKQTARIEHNYLANEYLLAYTYGTGSTNGWNAVCQTYIARTDNVGTLLNGPYQLYENPDGNALLPVIIFNPEKQEYLMVVTDANVFNEYQNNVGYIFNKSGEAIKGPFKVGTQAGKTWASLGVYNPTNDTYFIVWEDFRNVETWEDPCDMYGAVLDDEGNMIKEIAVLDDYGMEDEGDQRTPDIAYNPDKDEFFVVWKVKKPSLDEEGIIGAGIIGRFIDPDGNLKGEAFTVIDEPRRQLWPSIVYVEEEKKYFISWSDTRDDGLPPGDPWYFSEKMDIYARWLDDTGSSIGDEIALGVEEGCQSNGILSYNPVMKRFFVAWYDRNAPDDYSPIDPDPEDPFGERASDVRGTLYGVPSFLSGQVVEKGTGNPVENALVFVIGPSFPVLEQTNVGGWFNIEESSHFPGIYLVMAFKLGYLVAFEIVNYTGEPLEVTIEMNKLW